MRCLQIELCEETLPCFAMFVCPLHINPPSPAVSTTTSSTHDHALTFTICYPWTECRLLLCRVASPCKHAQARHHRLATGSSQWQSSTFADALGNRGIQHRQPLGRRPTPLRLRALRVARHCSWLASSAGERVPSCGMDLHHFPWSASFPRLLVTVPF